MPENLANNKGYFAAKKETTKGTAVIPNVFFPIYDENLVTDIHMDEDNPIVGNKHARFQTLLGMRSHGGEVTFLAEPNTAGYLMDMFMTKGTTTGANPYTHPFTISNTTNPNSYTVDISKGQVVWRFIGVEISEVGMDFDENKMVFKCKFAALKSFIVREISSVSTNVVTFKTNYDASPTDGLVATDLVRIEDVSAGTFQDFTVSSITSTTATLSGSPTGIVAGDLLYLRPQTPTYTLREPFLWTKTEFRIADTAANALSAAQTRLEKGAAWTMMHNFEEDEGAKRSGAFDPAALVRTQSDVTLEFKKFFDTPEDFNAFVTNTKKAIVIRHFSEGSSYEFRVTINNLKFMETPVPLKTGEIIYAEGKLVGQYDTSDAQAFDVKVLNAVVTI